MLPALLLLVTVLLQARSGETGPTDLLRQVHVAYTVNSRAFDGLLPSMISLASNLAEPSSCQIHIILPEEDMQLGAELVRCYERALAEKEISPPPAVALYKLEPLPFETSSFVVENKREDLVQPIVYARWYLHKHVPRDVPRIVYLDYDTITYSDIADLHRVDMHTALAARLNSKDGGCQEIYPECFRKHADMRRLIEQMDGRRLACWNAGVLVFDLMRWRAEDLASVAKEWLPATRGCMGDQLALNLALNGTLDPLPSEWHSSVADAMAAAAQLGVSAAATPHLVHFPGLPKPWHEHRDEALDHLVDEYVPMTRCNAIPNKANLVYEKMVRARFFAQLVAQHATRWVVHGTWLHPGGDITTKVMPVRAAKELCREHPECRGFTFEGPLSKLPVKIHFKSHAHRGATPLGWMSYELKQSAEAIFGVHSGFLAPGGDLYAGVMSLRKAKVRCSHLPRCRGFTFDTSELRLRASPTAASGAGAGEWVAEDAVIHAHFKDRWVLLGAASNWRSHRLQVEGREEEPVHLFTAYRGRISQGGDLETGSMGVEEAKGRCAELPGCKGFCFFEASSTAAMREVHFKGHGDVLDCDGGWTSYLMAAIQLGAAAAAGRRRQAVAHGRRRPPLASPRSFEEL